MHRNCDNVSPLSISWPRLIPRRQVPVTKLAMTLIQELLSSIRVTVLVRVVAPTGNYKIADRWETHPYKVVKQVNPDIPVYVVKQERDGSSTRTLHRNLLLPFNSLPLPDPTPNEGTCTGTEHDGEPHETQQSADETDLPKNHDSAADAGSLTSASDTASEDDSLLDNTPIPVQLC